MHWRNPNKPECIKDPRPEEARDYDSNTGDAKRDGYTVVARRPCRPCVKGMTEPVEPAIADRIERSFRTLPDDMGY